MTDLAAALASIDSANAADPNDFEGRPLALAQGRLADGWVQRLDPGAPDALRLAARAHHLRRWIVPRDTYPEGRDGYLRWRRDQKLRHAEELGELLLTCGLEAHVIERATRIVAKRGLGTDPDVQTFEDAVSLTFIQTQFVSTADKLGDDDKMVDVVAKTLRKMSPSGRAAASTIPVDERSGAIITRAIAAAP